MTIHYQKFFTYDLYYLLFEITKVNFVFFTHSNHVKIYMYKEKTKTGSRF